MSDIEQVSNAGSLPSSTNASTMDYPDEDNFEMLFPKKENVGEEISSSIVASIDPTKMRMMRNIEKILPTNTKEYIEFITEIYYKWKIFGTKYPSKYSDIIRYIESRV